MNTRERPSNRLQHESSPYLRQHAGNPVDWYPWGDEALERARSEDRPIFLSIGYSACHWCHVMEHESFENADIARLMNDWFVNIKVDREERPDLDQIYMSAVTTMTGSGGWPMSVFLMPDQRPFFGGTYWPPERRWGRPGFREILAAVHEAWTTRRDAVTQQADELTDAVVASATTQLPASPLNEDLLRTALHSLLKSADRVHGGFGRAPKFPHAMDVRLLLRLSQRFGDQDSLDVASLTLEKMARGGIYDHLGGGFSRYSTDEVWLVPHFEKMLYDNALLIPCYIEAWQLTGREDFRTVARESLDYVLREMLHPEGGFYSTQDADSEGVEGKFFVWSLEELSEALGPDDARVFAACYDVTEHGNWEHTNILNLPKPLAECADALGLPLAELTDRLADCRRRLFEVRSRRIAPGRDEKIMASWNGMMLSACALGFRAFGTEAYRTAARQSADFILNNLMETDGRLLHVFKDGRARFNGYLDDYAAMIDGLLDVAQICSEQRYVRAAVQLAERMIEQFTDPADGGFFYTSEDHEELIARQKDQMDNATPSGNSLACTGLHKLGRLTGRTDFFDAAERTLTSLSGLMQRAPMAAGQALLALETWLSGGEELVLVTDSDPISSDVLSVLGSQYRPHDLFWHHDRQTETDTSLMAMLDGKTEPGSLYICRDNTCRPAIRGRDDILAALEKAS
jgi:uncharacterized protein YyaL (SSP411 family)